jgi:hypothetical protein
MRKSHFNDEFLVLLGPIISRPFTFSNAEKRALALVLSLCFLHTEASFLFLTKQPILMRRSAVLSIPFQQGLRRRFSMEQHTLKNVNSC